MNSAGHYTGGWYIRHKACTRCELFVAQTPYFLITDADTFFIRDLEALDLMDQQDCTSDSGICDLQKKVQMVSSIDREDAAGHCPGPQHVRLARQATATDTLDKANLQLSHVRQMFLSVLSRACRCSSGRAMSCRRRCSGRISRSGSSSARRSSM